MVNIDKRLLANGEIIAKLALSSVIFANNKNFPWLILIPRIKGAFELMELGSEEQEQVMKEITLSSNALKSVFSPDKLNIASLGNVVPQLHVHVIGRYFNDVAFPNPPFGLKVEKYSETEYKALSEQLQKCLT